ncbi:MAG: hypothetical protein GX058_10140 [Firmicutes bacterium]|nr:hypothetical protein [Bacillota bacterium]
MNVLSRGIIIGVVLALALSFQAVTLAAEELQIRVLENKLFKMEGENVHIIGLLEISKGDLFLTAGEIIYNSELKQAKLMGAPYLRTSDAEVSGDEIAADFDAELFTFAGGVKIIQTDRLCQADQVIVDNRKETYRLTGNVVVLEEKNQKELRAAEVLISSNPDRIEVYGPVEISFVLDKQNDEPEVPETSGPTGEVAAGEIYVQVESLPVEY